MYADRVEATAGRSVKERLNGNTVEDSSRRRQVTGKRQRQDDKWEHDLFANDEPRNLNPKLGTQDLRLKLQRRGGQQGFQIIRGSLSGVGDLREKLAGTMTAQPVNVVDLPRTKPQAIQPVRKSVPAEAPKSETRKAANVASKTKSQQKAETTVDSFLQSLGLEKYLINFQVEEVDMTTLVHMSGEELKAIGIPMGPRKKISLALEAKG